MAGQYTLTMLDYSVEKSPFRVTTISPNAASFTTWESDIASLKTAIAAITLGVQQQEVRTTLVDVLSNTPPTNALAQRESKWLVTYKGNTSQKLFRAEIPTAELAGHLLPASDEADLTETDMAAFVNAFETVARSPDNGTEACTVLSIRAVGRNI